MIFVGFGIFEHFGPETIGLNLSFFADLVDITVNEFAITDDDFAIDEGMANFAVILDDAEIGHRGLDGTSAILNAVEGTDFSIKEIADHAPAAIEAMDDVDGIVFFDFGLFLGEIEFDVHITGPAIDAEGDFLCIAQRIWPTDSISVV